MWLMIEAAPLNGRWSLSDAWRRDRADWPPAPDTLHSAAVAAAAGADWGEPAPPDDVTRSRYGAVLAWLERLGPPQIEAPMNPAKVEGLTWFVPVGDDAGLEPVRVRKARCHNSVGADAPVRWAWRVAPEEAMPHQPLLAEIVERITRIGSSRGPVLAAAKLVDDAAWRPSLVPDEDGEVGIRGIYPGRLADLERWFRAGERPRPGPIVAYARPEVRKLVSGWGDILILRKLAGIRLDVSRSVDIAESARNALLAHLGDDAPEVLTGHPEAGAVSHRDHLAIVPMARLGDAHADGAVLGVGLVVPRATEDAVWLRLVGAVGRWMAAGGRLIISGRTSWTLELAADDHRATLRPGRLRRPAQHWASATPVALDRHPRPAPGRLLPDIVTAMCERAGLPPPARVKAGMSPPVAGSAASRAYGLGTRHYLTGRYITHLELAWERPVPGPILLGTGRHFGLGLMLPVPAAWPGMGADA